MLKEQPKQKLHTKIIELKVYDMVLVFSFFKLTKNSVMFRLMYIFLSVQVSLVLEIFF